MITRHSTMGEVLEAYPSAQRALFQRYHIGGCNSCGYQPGDTLDAVARSHNILDVGEVIAFLEDAEQLDRRIQVSPVEVAAEPDLLGGAAIRPLRSTVSEAKVFESSRRA